LDRRVKFDIVQSTYRRWAPFYDAVFGAALQPGRRHIVRALNGQSGQDILEVGVGTGLSLPLYPPDVHVIGIDVCWDMLKRAQTRVRHRHLTHVEGIAQMDAQNMGFASGSFDKVVAMYVLTVLPDPLPLITEMRRVCKPDGELVFVNHFHSGKPIEHLLSPLSKWVNYRSDLLLEDFLAETQLEVIEMRHANLFGYATMLRCWNRV
jgi:phosphatidylethanolamine/phosphatidyl-N-methylethanolamine N-methyltransferase